MGIGPSPELSYILGVVHGDGYIRKHKGGYNVSLMVTDKDFVEEFNRAVCIVIGRSKHYKIGVKYDPRPHRKPRWYVEAFSKELYTFIKEGLDTHEPIIHEYPYEFIRGFFDSEGSLSIQKKQSYCLKMDTTDKRLAEFVANVLAYHGFSVAVYIYKPWGDRRIGKETLRQVKDIHRITIIGLNDVIRFSDLIGSSIKKKREAMKKLKEEIGI